MKGAVIFTLMDTETGRVTHRALSGESFEASKTGNTVSFEGVVADVTMTGEQVEQLIQAGQLVTLMAELRASEDRFRETFDALDRSVRALDEALARVKELEGGSNESD